MKFTLGGGKCDCCKTWLQVRVNKKLLLQVLYLSNSYENVLRQIKATELQIEETEDLVNQLSTEFKGR